MSRWLEDFFNAINRDDSHRVNHFLAIGWIDANVRLPHELNPPALVYAAGLGRKGAVDLLLRFGARIDDVDNKGCTACHAALGASNATDVLPMLLAHRPNLRLTNAAGHTALSYGFEFHSFAYPYPFYANAHSAALLIDAGAPLESVGRWRLCYLAATSTFAIQALLRRGVVISGLRDRQGCTPLHLAVGAAHRDSAVIHMLVNECGVELEVHNRFGKTCTHIAATNGNAGALSFLIAAGANLESVDKSNRTPLSMMGGEKCTILLLAAGADVHARDRFQRTACHVAALHLARDVGNMRSTVLAMLAAGADLDQDATRLVSADHRLAAEDVEMSSCKIAKVRLDFVRHRALQVCIGLSSLRLNALQMCEILQLACGPVAPLIAFHQWWKIATTVKHFKV
jgi:ankyrin repeat protein